MLHLAKAAFFNVYVVGCLSLLCLCCCSSCFFNAEREAKVVSLQQALLMAHLQQQQAIKKKKIKAQHNKSFGGEIQTNYINSATTTNLEAEKW